MCYPNPQFPYLIPSDYSPSETFSMSSEFYYRGPNTQSAIYQAYNNPDPNLIALSERYHAMPPLPPPTSFASSSSASFTAEYLNRPLPPRPPTPASARSSVEENRLFATDEQTTSPEVAGPATFRTGSPTPRGSARHRRQARTLRPAMEGQGITSQRQRHPYNPLEGYHSGPSARQTSDQTTFPQDAYGNAILPGRGHEFAPRNHTAVHGRSQSTPTMQATSFAANQSIWSAHNQFASHTRAQSTQTAQTTQAASFSIQRQAYTQFHTRTPSRDWSERSFISAGGPGTIEQRPLTNWPIPIPRSDISMTQAAMESLPRPLARRRTIRRPGDTRVSIGERSPTPPLPANVQAYFRALWVDRFGPGYEEKVFGEKVFEEKVFEEEVLVQGPEPIGAERRERMESGERAGEGRSKVNTGRRWWAGLSPLKKKESPLKKKVRKVKREKTYEGKGKERAAEESDDDDDTDDEDEDAEMENF